MVDLVSLTPETVPTDLDKMGVLGGLHLRYLRLIEGNSTARLLVTKRLPTVTFWNRKRLRKELCEVLQFLLVDCAALLSGEWEASEQDSGQWVWYVDRLFPPLYNMLAAALEHHERLFAGYLGGTKWDTSGWNLMNAAITGSDRPHPMLPLARVLLRGMGVQVYSQDPPPEYQSPGETVTLTLAPV